MSDLDFFLPLSDVRAEITRLATVHQNECAPLGAPHVEVIPGGTHAAWQGGAYLECQEAWLSPSDYGLRIRWSRPGSQGERCWRLSPWCAPADRLVFPGERVRGETRETVGQLTLSEAATVPCSKHTGSMLADCGCKPLAEVLGEDLPWEVTGKWKRPAQEQAATVAAPPAEPGAALKGGSVGPAGGLSDRARAVLEQAAAEDHAADVAAGLAEPSVGASQAEWDEHRARPRGWVVACEECQRVTAEDVVPDSVCGECGGEVELREWPDLEPNARALETIGHLEQVVRKARKAKELASCQVCCRPIRVGTRYLSPPGNSPRRRIHSMCVEAMSRAEGPV